MAESARPDEQDENGASIGMRSVFRRATVSLLLVVLFGISLPGYPERGRPETLASPDSTQQYLGGLFQSLMA